MRTTISARHCDLTDALRERAEEVLARLAELTPFVNEGTAVFDQGPVVASVEIRLRASGAKVLVGTGEGDDHRTALDRAEEKIRRQLHKTTRPRQARRATPEKA